GDDLLVAHLCESLKVERAILDVRRQVSEIEALLARKPDPAQIFHRGLEQLSRSGKAPPREKPDEAIVNCASGSAGQLLKDDRAAERREALAPERQLDRADRIDDAREYRIGEQQMRLGLAGIGYVVIRHRARIIANCAPGASGWARFAGVFALRKGWRSGWMPRTIRPTPARDRWICPSREPLDSRPRRPGAAQSRG